MRQFATATLMLGAAPWTAAGAQGTASTNNFYCVAQNALNPQIVTVANASVSRTCTGAGNTATTSASAIGGVLRASTSFAPSTTPAGNSVVATASWDDYLRVRTGAGAPEAVFAKLTIALNGTVDPGQGSASANFQVRGGEVIDLAYVRTRAEESLPVNLSFDYVIRLYGGGNMFGGGLYMALFSGALGSGSSSQFGNSAGVTGLTILDANRQSITDATFSWDRGLTFYQPPTAVPEPSVVILLAVGLAVMAALRLESARNRARAR